MLTASVSIRIPFPAQTKPHANAAFFHMYTVYILYSESQDTFYKGQTRELSERIKRHNHRQEKAHHSDRLAESPTIPFPAQADKQGVVGCGV
jgi:hypothetical protein